MIIKVSDFTEFPGPRHKKFGEFSGEEFRDSILVPALMGNETVVVDLDGVMGYGSSFLEEAFAGLLREGVAKDKVLMVVENLISRDDPSLISEIDTYVKEEIERCCK
ncbi:MULTISPECIES: STAS-like domain-containing protein [Pseudoalteromonas]|uniref:DUF4325 domain-containing protein n=1 Tax=Pseudoalteromonas maricaloris TaxID=184924 RepID=A0A8I2HBN5_9GAMM|nr:MULTISPECIES: STAS-like domain-containing protein [Pseudoalteromonas]NLR22590.1 DUF4325 domain-containing protein [Pseudoalteromonas maricaloris]RZG14763.1 DUF4325 domain-containing protein [Pseudoalteromonas sp. CO342X]WOX29515.1 STAS-like domain-containing protein [Pseudoalteromonas maricaloris]